MKTSDCCGTPAGEYEEQGICPSCHEHCEWMEECPECEGGGMSLYICLSCNGSGEGMADGTKCLTCNGKGEIPSECETCDGLGLVYCDE